MARFVNVALWLALAALAVMTFRDAFVASPGTCRVRLRPLRRCSVWVLWLVLARRARELWALVKAIPTQLIQTATSPDSPIGAYLCASGSSAGRFEFP